MQYLRQTQPSTDRSMLFEKWWDTKNPRLIEPIIKPDTNDVLGFGQDIQFEQAPKD